MRIIVFVVFSSAMWVTVLIMFLSVVQNFTDGTQRKNQTRTLNCPKAEMYFLMIFKNTTCPPTALISLKIPTRNVSTCYN